jgi:hypothetical protein
MTEPVAPAPMTDAEYLLALIDTTFETVSEVRRHHERMRAIATRLTATQAPAEPPIARLLHWSAPTHIPVPHGGICARTYAEFPKGAGEGAGYWKEGAPLYEAAVRAQAPSAARITPADLSRIVHEALGEASMMWEPRPIGVFKSSEACEIAARLIDEICAIVPAPSAAAIQLTAERDNWKRWCEEVEGQALVWAVERWNDEVKNRPLINKNRRTLDDTWRQVIRHFGGDPGLLVGKSHDELRAAGPAQGEQS